MYLSSSMISDQRTSIPQMAGIVLADLRFYLESIDPVIYQSPLELLSGSTIGQHTRHIIEFYNCLLEQSYQQENPIINYAKRRRDHAIESRPEHALYLVNDLCERLLGLDPDQPCELDCTEHGQDDLLVSSTIGRELIYNIE